MTKLNHLDKPRLFSSNQLLSNRNQHLNPKFSSWLTDCINVLGHGLTLQDKKFLKRCYNINVLSGIPICYDDFKGILGKNYKGNFRARKTKLKSLFELVIKGKPCYYKLTGLYLDKELTNEYTSIPISERIFANLDILLSMTSHEKPQIHNILFGFKTHELYQKLIELGYSTHQNKAITIKDIPVDKIIKVNAEVYPNGLILLRIACTYSPIDYSPNGFISLFHLLGKIEHCLKTGIAFKDFQIEPVNHWKFKHFDLNKDSISYDFPTDEYTVSMIFGHVQVYNKKFPNGKQKIRVEEQLEPNTTSVEELSSSRFQKASELFYL